MVDLRDGSTTEDERLGRLIQFDERSRQYPLRAPVRRLRSYTWRIDGLWLNQGREGACVAFAGGHELAARPSEVRGSILDFNSLVSIYHEAQKIDPWPGGMYPGASPRYEGTSVLAGIKALHRMGYFEEYRWAFNMFDLAYGVGHNGPVWMGTWWYEGMYNTDANGYLHPTGAKVGGHSWIIYGVKIVKTNDVVDFNKSYFKCRNSWGRSWGVNGDFKLSLKEAETLLMDDGEAAFLLKRKTKP